MVRGVRSGRLGVVIMRAGDLDRLRSARWLRVELRAAIRSRPPRASPRAGGSWPRPQRLTARDRLLYLVSGGTSALFEVPRPESTTSDPSSTPIALLLASGMPIDDDELRAPRGLSAVKGGGLARAASAAAEITTLADLRRRRRRSPPTIGSGPTVIIEEPRRACAGVSASATACAVRCPARLLGVLRARAERRPAARRLSCPHPRRAAALHTVPHRRHSASWSRPARPRTPPKSVSTSSATLSSTLRYHG